MSAFDQSTSTSSTLPSARHKYANLPDVDINAPDVYETPSVPKTRRRRARARRDDLGEGRKTAGAAGNSRDDEDDDDDDYSFGSEEDESVESSDDDTPYKVRKVPRGWTKAAPRVEIESSEIERTSLRKFEAQQKFRNAVELDGSSNDFSDRLKRNRRRDQGAARRGRDAGITTTTYQLGGPSVEKDEPETLVDRLRRLKFEASLLEEEIAKTSDSATPDGEGKKDTATTSPPTKVASDDVPLPELLSQLRILKAQLAQLDASDHNAHDASLLRDRATWELQTKSLLQKLADAATATASPSSTVEERASNGAAQAAPAPAAAGSTAASMATLDRRLAELEEALGVNEAALEESKAAPKPILPTLNRLEQQLQLLSQPRHLDAISRRVKVLVTELERVQDSRQKLLSSEGAGTGGTGASLPPFANGDDGRGDASTPPGGAAAAKSGLAPEELAKLQQLFSVSTRLDPLLPLIPTLLGRMQTLSDLHASSVHFAQTLDELEARKQLREREDREASELMAKLEKSMEENGQRMQDNLLGLEERIASLGLRMERLSSA
ncbi:hypothetical protein ACQY0O_005947 [Thecaphora frezii]